MEVVLQQINKIQGIAGCFVCDEDGKLLGQALPPMYDEALLQEASGIIADSVVGVNAATGGVVSFDLRFSEGRIIVRPVQSSYLLLLCEQKINVQLLNMSLSVAQKKLEKAIQVVKEQPAQTIRPVSKPAVAPVIATVESRELRRDGKGVILVVETMKPVYKAQLDQMKEEVAVSKDLLQQLFSAFKTGSVKRVKILNKSANRSKVMNLNSFEPDPGQQLADKIILTLVASDVLAVKPGDEVTVELAAAQVFESDLIFAGL